MPTVPRSTRPPWLPERVAHGRRTNTNKHIYKSKGKQWEKFAMWHKRCNPLCVVCGAPVEVTDHIVPINQGGQVYALDNLQSLCHPCHNSKSGKETKGRGRSNT